MKKFLGLVVLLATSTSHAGSVVCKTQGRKPLVVIQYSVSDNQSARLDSAIVFTANGTNTFFDMNSVAQYGTAKEALYFLVDNASQIPVLRLWAPANRTIYTGELAEYGATGKIVKSTKVDCSLTR